MTMQTKDIIKQIKTAIEARSGKKWSVTSGRGTACGWITIDAPPARRTMHNRLKEGAVTNHPKDYEEYDSGVKGGYMTMSDRQELATLLGLERVHCQGVSIPSSNAHYKEYLQRATDGKADKIAQAYWD